jgi:hypothetical protein
LDIRVFEVVKIGRLKWPGHLFRMQELDPYRQLTVLQPENTRRVGRPKLRWCELAEEDLKNIGVRNWRRKQQGREQKRGVLEESKDHKRL